MGNQLIVYGSMAHYSSLDPGIFSDSRHPPHPPGTSTALRAKGSDDAKSTRL